MMSDQRNASWAQIAQRSAMSLLSNRYIAVTLFDRMLRRESIRGNKLPDTTAPNRGALSLTKSILSVVCCCVTSTRVY